MSAIKRLHVKRLPAITFPALARRSPKWAASGRHHKPSVRRLAEHGKSFVEIQEKMSAAPMFFRDQSGRRFRHGTNADGTLNHHRCVASWPGAPHSTAVVPYFRFTARQDRKKAGPRTRFRPKAGGEKPDNPCRAADRVMTLGICTAGKSRLLRTSDRQFYASQVMVCAISAKRFGPHQLCWLCPPQMSGGRGACARASVQTAIQRRAARIIDQSRRRTRR